MVKMEVLERGESFEEMGGVFKYAHALIVYHMMRKSDADPPLKLRLRSFQM